MSAEVKFWALKTKICLKGEGWDILWCHKMSKKKAIFRWVEGILWWFASIWLDFGTICEDWRHFVRFGDDLGHVVMNLWPSRIIGNDLLKFWVKFCRLEASRSDSEAIRIDLGGMRCEKRLLEALYGSVRQFRAICDGLMTFSDDLSETRSKLRRWRHSMMSLVSEFEVLGWLVEITASSGTVKLNLRRFEGLVVKRYRIQTSRLPITMKWWQWNN